MLLLLRGSSHKGFLASPDVVLNLNILVATRPKKNKKKVIFLLLFLKNDFCELVCFLSCSRVLPLLQVTEETFKVLSKLGYSCDCRGLINVKGKGELKTFFVCTDMSKQQGMGLS